MLDFDYNTSWLNPALKFVIAGLYIVVAFVYLRARRFYAGDLHKALSILLWMGAIACAAAIFRYLGHGTQFGFTPELSLKWFESLGYLVQAVLLALAARWLAKGIVPDVRG